MDKPQAELVKPPGLSSGRRKLLSWLLICTTLVLIALLLRPLSQTNPPASTLIQITPTPSIQIPDQRFFLNSVPKPISWLSLTDIPNSGNIVGVVPYQDKYIFVSEDTIFEYDPQIKQIVRYSNPYRAACDRVPVVVGHYLYVPCRSGSFNKADVANYPKLEIFKIDLTDFSLVRTYSSADGLYSGDNFKLASDGSILWVATSNGLGKIDTLTDQISFYTSGLNVNAKQPQIADILIDTNYDWFFIPGQIGYPNGGLSLYDKSINKFTGFNVSDLKQDNQVFNLQMIDSGYAWKLVPGGVEIGFDDTDLTTGKLVSLVKQYSYTDQTWKTIKIFTQGNTRVSLEKYFQSNQPKAGGNVYQDIYSFSRSPLAISDEINGKKYILTSSSIDVIDDSMDFPQTLINLPSRFSFGLPSYSDRNQVLLEIDPQTLTGFAFHEPFGGETCTDAILFIFALSKPRILKKYSIPCNKFPDSNLTFKNVKYSDHKYIVSDNSENLIFTVNMNTLVMTFSPNQ